MNCTLRLWIFKILLIGVCLSFINSLLLAKTENPEKIISLGPAVTRQLSLLQVEDKIIGVTIYCNIPNLADRERVGTIVDANLEKILTLQPDLVIATALTDPKTIQTLKKFNIRTVVFDSVMNFAQLNEQFLGLAELANKEKLAQDIVSKVEDKVSDIQQKVQSFAKPKVLVQVGTSPLWAATKNCLINDFIELAGGINIGPSSGNGLISREYVVKHNPDIIIIIDMGIVTEEEKEIWGKFKSINAVINEQIYVFDSYGIGSPTPVSFVETLDEIFKLLHQK